MSRGFSELANLPTHQIVELNGDGREAMAMKLVEERYGEEGGRHSSCASEKTTELRRSGAYSHDLRDVLLHIVLVTIGDATFSKEILFLFPFPFPFFLFPLCVRGFSLPVAHVIHTVGPVFTQYPHPAPVLAAAYKYARLPASLPRSGHPKCFPCAPKRHQNVTKAVCIFVGQILPEFRSLFEMIVESDWVKVAPVCMLQGLSGPCQCKQAAIRMLSRPLLRHLRVRGERLHALKYDIWAHA